MATKPRILVAPLDWGLGHAARCVPVIAEVIRQGGEPVLASAGRAHAYLKAEFPELKRIELPAYDIRYYSGNMHWNMARQAPKLLRAAWWEHRQLQRLIRQRKIDAVISDNRFGCFSSLVPCVFITHQLNIQVPYPPLRWLANCLNRWFIRRYDECWIPDRPGAGSLAGELSRPQHRVEGRIGTGIRPFFRGNRPPEGSLSECYIGLLSRLRAVEEEKEYDILALLSGPEPQRSRLEAMLIRQLKELSYKVLLVQGRTEREGRCQPAAHIEVVSYLKAAELQSAINRSTIVICRSGYSTLMDLAATGKKALLIPTPGQTEQEYLARRMQEVGYCPFRQQSGLNLGRGIREALEFPGFPGGREMGEGVAAAVKGLLARIGCKVKGAIKN